MQVGASTTLSAQLQALENAVRAKYQGGQDFSFQLQMADGSGGDAGGAAASGATGAGPAAGNGALMSGSFQAESLVAVGTMSGGQLVPFSAQQIQGEEAAVGAAGTAAYSDALQNFLMLSQAGGQTGATSLSDHEQFSADNGLIAGSFDTSFSLAPVGGGTPPVSS